MGVSGGPDVVTDGLVLALDVTNPRSFKGEPTTNLTRNSRDFSGTQYSATGFNEYTSITPTSLIKTYDQNVNTPTGNGATLIQESGSAGFHYLSRWGGDGTGSFSLSCYVYPVTNDITNFSIGLLESNISAVFNLTNGTLVSTGSVTNPIIESVSGYPGWYRVGVNMRGRTGGWVGSMGYNILSRYTGSLGSKKCYVAGIQYELKNAPTPFIEAQQTRGTTVATGGGWADVTGNNNHGELVNGPTFSSANGGSIVFDGVDDYAVTAPTTFTANTDFTYELFVKSNSFIQARGIFGNKGYWSSGGQGAAIGNISSPQTIYGYVTTDTGHFDINSSIGPTYDWTHVVMRRFNNDLRFFINGVHQGTTRTISGVVNDVSDKFWMGSHNTGTANWLGNIALIRVYNRALSAQEILQNFNTTRSRFGV